MLSVLQVVVFALGVGSTVAHAQRLIMAFQQLCSTPQQQQVCHDQGLASNGQEAQDTPLQAASESQLQQPSQDVNSLQRVSLREAFWSRSVR